MSRMTIDEVEKSNENVLNLVKNEIPDFWISKDLDKENPYKEILHNIEYGDRVSKTFKIWSILSILILTLFQFACFSWNNEILITTLPFYLVTVLNSYYFMTSPLKKIDLNSYIYVGKGLNFHSFHVYIVAYIFSIYFGNVSHRIEDVDVFNFISLNNCKSVILFGILCAILNSISFSSKHIFYIYLKQRVFNYVKQNSKKYQIVLLSIFLIPLLYIVPLIGYVEDETFMRFILSACLYVLPFAFVSHFTLLFYMLIRKLALLKNKSKIEYNKPVVEEEKTDAKDIFEKTSLKKVQDGVTFEDVDEYLLSLNDNNIKIIKRDLPDVYIAEKLNDKNPYKKLMLDIENSGNSLFKIYSLFIIPYLMMVTFFGYGHSQEALLSISGLAVWFIWRCISSFKHKINLIISLSSNIAFKYIGCILLNLTIFFTIINFGDKEYLYYNDLLNVTLLKTANNFYPFMIISILSLLFITFSKFVFNDYISYIAKCKLNKNTIGLRYLSNVVIISCAIYYFPTFIRLFDMYSKGFFLIFLTPIFFYVTSKAVSWLNLFLYSYLRKLAIKADENL